MKCMSKLPWMAAALLVAAGWAATPAMAQHGVDDWFDDDYYGYEDYYDDYYAYDGFGFEYGYDYGDYYTDFYDEGLYGEREWYEPYTYYTDQWYGDDDFDDWYD